MGSIKKTKVYLLIASLNVVMAFVLVMLAGSVTPVNAAAGINSQLSFEGKLVNSNGTNISNGTYNMQFKIYQDGNNMGSGSTLKWTENRLVGGSGGVTLVDGTFHVNLGSVTTFGSSVDWNQDTLWLSMQIGNTSSCTIATSFQVDCSGDGEMTPYIRLTAVPYANNSAMLSGLVAGNFVQLAQGMQTDSSTTNSSIAVNKTGSTANILQLQKSSADVFVINNSGRITLQPAADLTSGQTHVSQTLTNGSSSGGTVNGYSQTISIANTGSASTTNGINIAITDNAAPSNTNKGISIALDGNNTAQTNTGLYVSVTGSNLISYGINSENSTDGGLGVRGHNNATGAVAKVYYGTVGGALQTAAAAYTSYGVSGSASAGTGATAYGGYFSVSGNATSGAALYATNVTTTNNILKLQDNTTDVLSVADGGATTFQASTSSGTSFRVLQATTNGSLLNVDSTNANISLLGLNSAALSPWAATTAINVSGSQPRFGANTVTANGYVYIIGGENAAFSVTSTAYYAKLNSDGTIGAWTATSSPGSRWLASTVVANGYIYLVGGQSTANSISTTDTVSYAKLNADGTIGTWSTTTSINVSGSQPRAAHTSVVANGYLYVIGGHNTGPTTQDTVYYARLNSDGTVGTWATTSSINVSAVSRPREYHSSVVANGYLYVIGGTNSGAQDTVYYARLNSDGTIGTWSSTTSINVSGSQVRYGHTSVVVNGYLYVMGGYDGTTYKDTVYYAKLNADGTTGAWASTTALNVSGSKPRYRATSVVVNGYLYVMGGYDGTNVQDTVYYASTSRIQLGGSLDLISLQGQNLADGGDLSQGSTGGSITAGNITAVGALQVQGQGSFAQGLSANGNLTVGGFVALQPASSLTAGQNHFTQTFTNASSSGGTVIGYDQNITVSNTVSASTTKGIELTITDNSGLTNTAIGLDILFNGSNGNQNQTGVLSQVVRGIGLRGASTGASTGTIACGATTANLSIGVCGSSSLAASNAYGGYFTASGDGGTALYATNSTSTSNLLRLQDNTTDVLTVADGGRIAVNSTFTAMTTPTGLSAATPTSGGSLAFSTTYFYKVTAIDSAGGETAASTESSNTIAGSGSLRQIPLTWTAVTGASGYRIYRSTTTNTEVYLTSVLTNSYTDTGSVTIGTVSPPSTTTALVSTNNSNSTLQIAVGGSGTPTGQLYVGGRIPSSAVGTLKDLPNSANGIQIQGDYAYMGHGSGNSVPIINISNPLAPVQTGTFSITGSVSRLAIQGKYVYSAGLKLEVFDISNPTAPALKGSSTGSNVSYTDIEVQGNYAYTATFGNSMRVFDISNPAAPFPTASLVLNTSAGNSQNNLEVYGNYAYFIAPGTLYIVDISIPSAPSTVGSLAISSIRSVALQGKYAYIGTPATNKIQVVDISNPATPTLVGQLNPGFSGTVESLDIQGRYLYAVAGSSSNTVQVFDISNPYSPRSVGSFATDSSPAAIKIQGRYAYVVTGSNSMQVFDVGGTYTQQLEAGGIKTGTLSVNSSARISGDTSIQGGLQIGASVNASGNLGVAGGATIQGSTILTKGANLLSIPGTPTITPQGTTGAQRWDYTITAVNAFGGETTASAAGTTATGNATLSSTNFNRITWSTVSGATSYNIYRTYVTGATSPTSTGLIGSTTLTTFDDTALSASGDSPTVNTTGQLTVLGSALFKNTANTTAAFEIQNSSGTSVLKADTSTNTVTAANLTVTGTCTGCGGGATSLDDAYNQSAGTGNTITLTAAGDGVIIQDASTTVGGNLFAVQENSANGGSNLFAVTTTGLLIEATSGNDALTLNTSTSTPELRVHGSTDTEYVRIWFDSATDTAYFGASTGTSVLGSGTGAVNVTAGAGAAFVITGNAASSIITTAGDLIIEAGSGTVSLGASTELLSDTPGGLVIGVSPSGAGSLTLQAEGGNSVIIEGDLMGPASGTFNIASSSGQNIYLDSNAGTIVLGSSTTKFQTVATAFALELNAAVPTTFTITNTDAIERAALSVEGSISAGLYISSAGNITSGANSTINSSSGTLTLQGASSTSLLSTSASSVTVDSGTTGNVIIGATNNTNAKNVAIGNNNSGSTVDIDGGTGATGIEIGNTNTAHGIQIGTNATAANVLAIGGTNASSTLTLEGGTGASAIQIGNGATAHGIQIGTGAAIQTIVVGSTNSTSKLTLQGGILTTTTNNSGIIIGGGYSSSDTSLIPLTLDSTSTFTETASTCTTSANGGTLYYNSTSNAIRACINGSWEDLMSTAGMGIISFGVVADSGNNPGDVPSLVTTGVTGPCKVSWLSATSIRIAPCTAYSGGRKVVIAQTDITALGTTTTNLYANVCLTGTNGAPAMTSAATTQTSATIFPTFSAANPVLCLATIKNGAGGGSANGSFAGATPGQIYDVRTFTNTVKEFQTSAAALGLGYIAQVSGTGVTTATATLGTSGQRGVVVATNGAAVSGGNPHVIIATHGPAYVVAVGGTAGVNVVSGATASFANTSATTTFGIYAYLGTSRTTFASTCTSAATCLGSLYVDLTFR